MRVAPDPKPSVKRAERARKKRVQLLALSSLMTVLALEVVFRVLAWREDRATLEAAVDDEQVPPAGAEVTMAAVLKLSADPRIVYELKPNLPGVLYERRRLFTSSAGFRDREYEPVKPPGVVRIVGIGDSVMFGQGVEGEETYLALLERRLGEADPSRTWEVVNMGVPGYNTVMEVATLAAKGLAYQPDLVLLGFVSNDSSLPNFVRHRRDLFAWRESFLVAWVLERLGKVRFKAGLADAPRKDGDWDHGFADDPEAVDADYAHLVGWEAVEGALAELAAAAASHGFRVLMFAHRRNRITEQGLALGEELGFETLDLTPAVQRYMQEHGIDRYRGSELVVSELDPHPSPIQHEIACEEILARLAEMGFLEAR